MTARKPSTGSSWARSPRRWSALLLLLALGAASTHGVTLAGEAAGNLGNAWRADAGWKQTRTASGSGALANLGWTWHGDAANRLRNASSPLGEWEYVVGKGDELLEVGRPGGQRAYLTPGPAGRTDTIHWKGIDPTVEALAFDGIGQRIADARAAYAWTWGGQLAEVATTTGNAKAAGPRVGYRYDALGRLLKRTLLTADGDFVEAQELVWNGAELVARDGVNHAGEILWRVEHVPGPGGLDDSPQLRVTSHLHPADPRPPVARVFELLSDEMGSVTAVLERGAAGEPPKLKARVLYSPYGEALLEEGPTLLRVAHDLHRVTVAGVTQAAVDLDDLDGDGDEEPTGVPGALVYDFTCALDPQTLGDGVLVSRKVDGLWQFAEADFVVAIADDRPSQLVVMPTTPWQHGAEYRVTLKPDLRDPHGRRAVLPGTGTTYTSNVVVDDQLPADPEPLPGFPVEHPLTFDTQRAASATLDCGTASTGPDPCFPGGLNILFQGLWHDPTTGLAYARARWYDSRTASWLSPDPMGTFDSENQYAFVAGAPNMYTDPEGEAVVIPALVVAYFALRGAEAAIDRATDINPHANMLTAGLTGAGIEGGATAVSFAVGGPVFRGVASTMTKRFMAGGMTKLAARRLAGSLAGSTAASASNLTYLLGSDAVEAGILGQREWRSGSEYFGSTAASAALFAIPGLGKATFGRGPGGPRVSTTTRIRRFFWDPRAWRPISREYWHPITGNGPAAGRSLHHWLIPQSWTWVPRAIRNAGFNLLEMPRVVSFPGGLNSWMGFARQWGGWRGVAAAAMENTIRAAVPGSLAGGAYAGYEIRSYLYDGPPANPIAGQVDAGGLATP